MVTAIYGFVGLICLMMFALGAKSMFAPKSMVENFSVEPDGPAGLNTIRGVMGGLFIGSLAVLVAGLVTSNTTLFLAVATILGVIAIGRLVGIAIDGFDKTVVPPLVVELVMVTILIGAHTLGTAG